MASDGLTNRQIGDRLFLSPRTVSSHLHRSYPKLGVAWRHQLRDVIARASTPTAAHDSTGSETLHKSLLVSLDPTSAHVRDPEPGTSVTAALCGGELATWVRATPAAQQASANVQ